MSTMSSAAAALAAALLASISSAQAAPADQANPTPPTPAASAASPGTAQLAPVQVTATRQRLDAARNGLSPDTGSSIYRFTEKDIENLPLGNSTPMNQVILRSPGVVQDSYGQLHIRGDHANVQYRIDGVIIPESISGFGQSLETRFASSINVLTGALPAQYGYRTAGVVDILTKGDSTAGNGGRITVVGGSRGHEETSLELGGSAGAFSYYLTGSYLHDDVGIENPTAASRALHDETNQSKGFGYLSYLLDASSRVSLLFGSSNNRFQIPDVPGQTPGYMLDPMPAVDSATLDATQRERNRYTVLSYQSTTGNGIDYQLSLFNRATDVAYRPDPIGDLVFNGIAADIVRRNIASGVQADASMALGTTHTLRAGLFAQQERFDVGNHSTVFPGDDSGQTSTTPIAIQDDSRIDGHLWGVYVQDEWQPFKALTVNYGLRYDQVRTVVDENQWSPRLGAVYDLTSGLRVHAGFARYFTPPPTEKIDTTSIARFAGTTNALPSDANTAVKSERSDYDDVGVSWQATKEITLGIDGYDRRVRHLQDEGQFGNALIYSAFNYAEGRVSGVDLSASYRDKGFNGYANLGFTKARGKNVETGQFNFEPAELAYIDTHWVHLDHEQRLSASGGLSYRWADTTSVGVDALYGSGLRNGFANTGHLPSYTQVNLDTARSFDTGTGFGKFDARVSVLNVFDRSYELRDGSGIGVGAPQFGPRRSVYLALSKAF